VFLGEYKGGSRNLRKGDGPSLSLPFFPLPFLSRLPSLPSPLEVGPLNQLEGLGERCKLPQRVRRGARPTRNLVHSKAVRKPLVAII